MFTHRPAAAKRVPVLVLALSGIVALSCASPGGFNSTLSQHMYVHSSQVRALRSALVHGNLDAARSAATWLAEYQDHPDLPRGVDSPMEEIRRLAADVEAAATLEEASMATAAMGAACGACHAVAGDGPDLKMESLPPTVRDFKSDMQLHIWATERMWEGLIQPSTELWRAGASALVGAPLYPSDAEMGSGLRRLVSRVDGLAREAARDLEVGFTPG